MSYQVPNDAANVVKRLIAPIRNSGLNLTTDNYYIYVPLANDLYINHRLTHTGRDRSRVNSIKAAKY